MLVELVYDKRNVEGLEGAREIILAELTKRVHQIFPDAEVKGKSMQANGLNSDASKSDREKLNRMLEEMFEESDMWLVSEFPTIRQVFQCGCGCVRYRLILNSPSSVQTSNEPSQGLNDASTTSSAPLRIPSR